MSLQPRARALSIRRFLLAVALFGTPVPAMAEVRVSDAGPGVLTVEARNATVQQVIETLASSRTIELRAAAPLSKVVTGTYTGPLTRVLSRILEGYDHVIQFTASGVRLEIVNGAPGASRASSVAMPLSIGNRVSSNVDLDEENLAKAAAGASGPPPARPPAKPGPAPAPPHVVNGLVDLDNEIR
jgi:hypothetical protein